MTRRWPVRSADRPAGRQVPPKGADEASPRSGVSALSLSPTGIVSRPGASAFFVSDGPISSNSGRNGGKNAGRNYVSALPQRAMPVRCRPRFPSRNRRFPDRCRSPDCASTAFRCRCLLLRQKSFVLPCRRLLYPVPNGHTYLCRRKAAKARFDNRHSTSAPDPTLAPRQRQRRRDSFAPAGGVPIPRRRQPPPTHCGASRRNGRDLIIATRPAHQPLPSLLSAAAAQG